MNDDRIGISVELFGWEKAEKHLKEIQEYVKSLDGKKLKLAVDNTLENIKKDLELLKRAKVNIRMAKNKDLAKFTNEINELTAKKHRFQFDYNQVVKARNELAKLYKGSELRTRQNALWDESMKKWGVADDKEFFKKLNRMQDEINRAGDAKRAKRFEYDENLRRTEAGINKLKNALYEIKNTDITPRLNVQALYSKIRNFGYRMGSAMQSLGNGLSSITAPIDTLLRGTAYAAAYKGLNTITEGLSGSFERYDIMKTYPKIMDSMGVSSKKAEKSIRAMYESVLGLPTGLDTIVEAQKQYFLATNDMTKATKVAIAANNAFVAGGADDVQILQGQRQLRDLMSAGKLRISEWESLAKAMPGAFKAIQDELGVTRKQIMSGDVSAEKFANTLIKVGSEGGVVADAAEKMKHTFTAVGANIRNALRNAGMETIEALDKTLIEYDGGDVIDHLLKIKPAINDIKKSIIDWIKVNPDKITDFFEKLSKFDIKGLLSGIASGLGTLANIGLGIGEVINSFGGKNVGKFLVYSNLVAKAVRAIGGITRGLAAPNAGVLTGIIWTASKLKNFFKTTETASKFAKIGVVTKLKNFFARFKDVEKAATAGSAASAAGGLTPVNRKLATTASQSANLATSMKQIGVNFAKAVAPAAAIAVNVGVVWASVKMIADIGKTKINWGNTAQNLAGAVVAITGIQAFMKALSYTGLITTNPASILRNLAGSLSAVLNTGVFTLVAKMLGEINKVNLGKGFLDIHAKLAQIGLAITEMSAFLVGLGAIHVGTVGASVALNALGALSSVLSAGSFLAVTKALDAIAKLKVPSNDKIKEVADGMKKMTDMLLKKDIWDGFINSLKASDLSRTMGDLSSALGKVNSSMTSIRNISRQLTNFGKKGINETAIDTAVSNMRIVKRGMSKVFDAVNDFFGNNQMKVAGQRQGGAQGADTPDFQIGKFDKYLEMLTSVTNVLDQFKLISTKMASIKKAINTIKKTYGEKGELSRENAINTDAISNDIGKIVGVIKAITNDKNGLAALKAEAQKIQNLDLTNISTQISKIPKIMQEINNLRLQLQGQNWMSPIGSIETQTSLYKPLKGMMGGGDTGMVTGKGNVYGKEASNLINTIRGMVEMLKEISTELDKVPDMSGKASKLQKALGSLKGAVDYIKQINKSVGGEVINTSVLKQSIINVIRDMNEALGGVVLLQTNALAFKKALTGIKTALASVTNGKGGSATAFATALGKIPGKVQVVSNAVKGKGEAWKKELAGGFKGTAKEITDEVKRIRDVFRNLSFYSAGYTAGSSFARGFNAAMALISVPSRVSSGMSALEARTTGGRGYRGRYGKTGGLITKSGIKYMSKGGLVNKVFPGSPKGVDKVPVWGQSGEYMMRKKAVNKLGVGFLQRLNHLDLKGALNSLYMRGGQLAFATPTISIDKSTNIINNNNQQVHLTNNNASQGYQEGRASRFMRKL